MANRRLIVVLAVALIAAVAAVAYAAAALDGSAEKAQPPLGRYYVAVGADSWLVDTQTGRVWVATGGRKDAHWAETRVEGLNGEPPAKED